MEGQEGVGDEVDCGLAREDVFEAGRARLSCGMLDVYLARDERSCSLAVDEGSAPLCGTRVPAQSSSNPDAHLETPILLSSL